MSWTLSFLGCRGARARVLSIPAFLLFSDAMCTQAVAQAPPPTGGRGVRVNGQRPPLATPLLGTRLGTHRRRRGADVSRVWAARAGIVSFVFLSRLACECAKKTSAIPVQGDVPASSRRGQKVCARKKERRTHGKCATGGLRRPTSPNPQGNDQAFFCRVISFTFIHLRRPRRPTRAAPAPRNRQSSGAPPLNPRPAGWRRPRWRPLS